MPQVVEHLTSNTKDPYELKPVANVLARDGTICGTWLLSILLKDNDVLDMHILLCHYYVIVIIRHRPRVAGVRWGI